MLFATYFDCIYIENVGISKDPDDNLMKSLLLFPGDVVQVLSFLTHEFFNLACSDRAGQVNSYFSESAINNDL